MTADKGQTPIRLAAGEVAARRAYAMDKIRPFRKALLLSGMTPEQIIWADDTFSEAVGDLAAQLAAAEARVAVAAEDERDRLYELAEQSLAIGVSGMEWFHDQGAMLPSDRAALRNLTQETDNAD